MLLYLRVHEALKRKIDDLVSRGHYSDFNAAANVALENLVIAEQEEASSEEREEIVAGRNRQPTKSKHAAGSRPENSRNTKGSTGTAESVSQRNVFDWATSPFVSEDLVVPLPPDLFQPGQQVPVERWIFGQQNRILPAKINTRLFLMLLSESGAEIELFHASSGIAEGAADVFRFLDELDRRFGHGKDDLLSTGFPAPDSDKAKSRYANHFAAYEDKQGNLTGMLLQWKFAGVKHAKNRTYLLPTGACFDFASLSNPLLDRPVTEKPVQKFSSEEIAWLADHVAKNMPVEAYAYRTILSGLGEGHNTPDTLDSFVREHARGKTDVTAAFVSTQRTGAVSRMADLNLIRRQRDGTKVTYEVTASGEKWLRER